MSDVLDLVPQSMVGASSPRTRAMTPGAIVRVELKDFMQVKRNTTLK